MERLRRREWKGQRGGEKGEGREERGRERERERDPNHPGAHCRTPPACRAWTICRMSGLKPAVFHLPSSSLGRAWKREREGKEGGMVGPGPDHPLGPELPRPPSCPGPSSELKAGPSNPPPGRALTSGETAGRPGSIWRGSSTRAAAVSKAATAAFACWACSSVASGVSPPTRSAGLPDCAGSGPAPGATASPAE